MILSGDLAPGEQIGEESLAERCGVSRTPVREALRRLESEMLVRRTETQRCFVAEWSIDDVADSFELRAILESRAARRAAHRMEAERLRSMEHANREIGRAIASDPPDIAAFLEGNRRFHEEILAAAASPRLDALLGILVEQPVVRRTAMHYGADALERSHREHDELLAAFARKDGAWAESLMAAHVRRAFHAYADAKAGTTQIDAPQRARKG